MRTESEPIEKSLQKIFNTAPLTVFRLEEERQIVILAASGDDAAEIWRNRKKILEIDGLRNLAEIILYAGTRKYGSGFINQQNPPTRISKVVYANRFI